jgi:hypothetical protein
MKPYLLLALSLLLFGCGKTSTDYFPLGENIKWEYRIEKQLGSTQSLGKSIIVQQALIKADGIDYFPSRNANGETLYYSRNEKGILLSSKPKQNGYVFIKTPLESNTTWTRETGIELLNNRHESFSGGESFISQGEKIILENKIVSFDETITVPAGVFINSMRVDSYASVTVKERTRGIDRILIEQTEWYGQGSGLVKRIRKEISVPEKYRAEQLTELIKLEHY